MSTTTLQLAAAPGPSTSFTSYCDKHPQERVVGVCGACLANKLSSLIYTSTALQPQDLDKVHVCSSPLSNAHPVYINLPANHQHPHQDRLQTINEAADSTTQEICTEGLLCGTVLEAPFRVVNETCAEAELVQRPNLHSNIIEEQISWSCDVVQEKKPTINQHASSINEEVRSTNLEGAKLVANPYLRANKPIRCKRSKSLSGLKGERLIKAREYESTANTTGEQSNTLVRKVTLRMLFQVDDEEIGENRALVAAHTSEFKLGTLEFPADYRDIKEEYDRNSVGADAKQIKEAKDVHDNHAQNSHRCVPSVSTLSSSVCPSIHCKFKHSAVLNSLLCRKTGEHEKKGSGPIRRPSLVHETSRSISITSVNEGTQGKDESSFSRANYIASESMEALRRCRSKLERPVARSSISSSSDLPASPQCVSHSVDMKSERKFNLTARALAAEFPSILCSSAGRTEARVVIPARIEDYSCSCATDMEDSKEGQDLTLHVNSDSVAVTADIQAMASDSRGKHHHAHVMPNTAEEAESGEKTEVEPFSGNRKDAHDEGLERVNVPLPSNHSILGMPTVDVLSHMQSWTPGTTVMMRANLGEVHEEGSRADTDQAVAKGGKEEERGIPTYITATESIPSIQEVPMGVYCGSLSCSSSSGRAQQGSHKAPEEVNNGGVWEAYSNKSGKGKRPPASSRTVKIAPDQSGLLRFYLTPLRSSGRSRFSSTRRPPPKRHFWSLIFV